MKKLFIKSVLLSVVLMVTATTALHAQDESGAVHAEDWKGMDISSLTTSGGTYFEATINDDATLNELKQNGLGIQGVGFTLVSVDLVDKNGTYLNLYSQETVFDAWNVMLSIPASKFTYAENNYIIRCIYKDKGSDYTPVFKRTTAWNGNNAWSDITALQNSKKEGSLPGSTEEVYIYNVETGKFMYIGGDWGVKPELQYRDFGLKFRMAYDGDERFVFTSDVYTQGAGSTTGNHLGLMQGYYPATDVSNGITVDKRKATLAGKNSNGGPMYCYSRFKIERVSGETGDTYTYVLSLRPKEFGKSSYQVSNGSRDVYDQISDNTYYLTVVDNGEGGKKVVETTDASATGHWRFVPISEIDEAVRNATLDVNAFNGMNLDITYKIDNQGFNRNNDNDWTSVNASYHHCDYIKSNNKWIIEDSDYPLPNQSVNGKYYYGLMETANEGGMIYRSFTVPATGWYKVQCQGVSKTGNGQLFALVNNGTEVLSTVHASLNVVPDIDSHEGIIQNGTNRVQLGKDFYDNKYPVEAYFYAEEGQNVMIGIQQWGEGGYVPSSDLTAFDNFQIKFLGDIFVLDEDYDKCTDGNGYKEAQVGKTVILHRTFSKKDDGSYYWNTLTLPIDMTGTQVKNVFGDGVKLAKATGLDDENPYCITFETVNANDGIKAGDFYLIQPAKEPATPAGKTINIINKEMTGPLYTLGRRNVSKISELQTEFEDGGWNHPTHNSIRYHGTYLKKDGGVPGGSYVFSKGNMYHIKNAQNVKGFRFWIEDEEPNPNGQAKPFTLSISGVEDQQESQQVITTISEVETVTDENAAVYSLSGQFLGKGKQLLNSLPKGIYVVNNKKYMVK